MRENMRLYKAMPLRELIDKSINETLARSLYTSVTAFLSLLPMAIWGRQRGGELRRADDLRHRHRSFLVGVHRRADPAVPGRLADAQAAQPAANAQRDAVRSVTRSGRPGRSRPSFCGLPAAP
jgi:protein translocase subunit secF/protein translocase subunit secD